MFPFKKLGIYCQKSLEGKPKAMKQEQTIESIRQSYKICEKRKEKKTILTYINL